MTIDKKFVDDHMQDKNILYIPIISSINRGTNKYNLDSDGNVVRFITFFEHHKNFKSLTILLPKNNESHDIVDKWIKDNDNIKIIWSDNFGKHAGEQRSDSDVVSKMEMELFELINNPDNGNDFINSLDSSYVSLYAEIADRVDYRFKEKPTRNLHRMITRRIQNSVKDIKL